MSSAQSNPPIGNSKQAEKYINQLVELINLDKIAIINTDLSRFDPSSLQDHYRVDLKDYRVEVSHSKNPDNGIDSYVILFNNLKQVVEGSSQKTILAYMYLEKSQFEKFKLAAKSHMERKKKFEEEKRLKEALFPVDQVLESISKEVSNTEEIKSLTDDVVKSSLDSEEQKEENSVFTSSL